MKYSSFNQLIIASNTLIADELNIAKLKKWQIDLCAGDKIDTDDKPFNGVWKKEVLKRLSLKYENATFLGHYL